MTELIKSDNNFNDIDLELDDNLQNFINYVKNKENEEIPEATPYVISTQSAWCKIKNIDNINLSKVVSIIAKNIINSFIFHKNEEYFIQGLVVENLILRFDDIYKKKFKRTYIKFFGNVIDSNNYEDNLLMYNNIHFLESNSLKKQGRQKNKKDNENFYNSCSIIVKGEKERKCVNVKLFNNGQITLTGAKDELDGLKACEYLLSELKKHDDIFIDTSKEDIANSNIENYRITMINSDFNTNFKIDLLKLLDILNNLEEDRFIKFNPAVYRGLMIGFFWNKNKKIQNGCCNCPVKCTGKKKKVKDKEKDTSCKKITISIFKSGSVIITGGYLKEQIEDAYKFINELFKTYYHDIIKLSILDFIDEDESNSNDEEN